MSLLRKYCPVLLLLFFAACSSGESEVANSEKDSKGATLGEVKIEVTGSPEAMPDFERGLLLLHSFEYSDAADAFRDAQELDSTFVMAYWGEAMTNHKPLWQSQNYEEGRAILERLAPTKAERLATAKTDLERDLLGGLEVLYGEGTKVARDKEYSDYMAGLYEKYPGNHEVAAFYALSLMGSVPNGRDDEIYGKSAVVVQGIIEENPQHPGALHYLIHAYDDPGHAVQALTAANRYSKVAPDASHALHMPSHIYVAMGMWDDVVRSNIASYSASVNRMEEKELSSSGRSYHAFHWLMYGYLQQGRLDAATAVLDSAVTYIKQDPVSGARSYFTRMKSNYLVETGDWNGWAADIDIESSDLNILNKGLMYFSDAMIALKKGDSKKASLTLAAFQKEIKNASLLVGDDGAPMCSASGSISRTAASRSDIDQVEAMALELQALLANDKGDKKAAESYFLAAIDKEMNTSYSYGPPSIPYPTNELYAEWLLEEGRAKEALKQYDYALERGPNRRRALEGKRAAAEMLGDEDTVNEVNKILEEISRSEQEGWLT